MPKRLANGDGLAAVEETVFVAGVTLKLEAAAVTAAGLSKVKLANGETAAVVAGFVSAALGVKFTPLKSDFAGAVAAVVLVEVEVAADTCDCADLAGSCVLCAGVEVTKLATELFARANA